MAAEASWNDEENRRFEDALARYVGLNLSHAEFCERMAQAVGGGKTPEDIRRHYQLLEVNIDEIDPAPAPGHAHHHRDALPTAANHRRPNANGGSGSGSGRARSNGNSRSNRPQQT